MRWRAFRPKPTDRELSIARISGLAEAEIWQLGEEFAGAPSGRSVSGRADVTRISVVDAAAAVKDCELDVEPDEPPVRHAVIVGWPDSNESARKVLAMELAARATQRIR